MGYLSFVSHLQQGAFAGINEGGDGGHANAALERTVNFLEHQQQPRTEVDVEQVSVFRIRYENRLGQVSFHRTQLEHLNISVTKLSQIYVPELTERMFQERSKLTPICAILRRRFLHLRVTSRPRSLFKIGACSYSRCSRHFWRVQHHIIWPGTE